MGSKMTEYPHDAEASTSGVSCKGCCIDNNSPACHDERVNCKVEKGSLMENQTGVLEPEVKFERRYAVGIVNVVATVNNGVIPLRMFNPHSKPQRIYKGSTIGQLYPLSATTEKNEQEQPCY